MKKHISIISSFIFILFTISTLIALFFAYTNFYNSYIKLFINFYLLFLIFFILYVILMTFFNLTKLKWIEIRKRLFKFFIIFIPLWSSHILFTYFTKGEINIFDKCYNAFGLAFGITFLDLLFIRKIEK